jgi:hypothetical protein
MTTISINPVLMDLARVRTGLSKTAFIPAGAAAPPGGDPSAGGAPPPGGDPSMGGPPPGGDPSMGGMPPGGDPSMGGPPPAGPPPGGDPAAAGGAAPIGLPPEVMAAIGQVVSQAVQQASQGGAPGAPGAPGGGKKGGKNDEQAMQMYKTNVFLMAIITGLNKAGIQIEIPPEAMLGPPPGTDPAMAGAAGAAIPAGPGVASPGADPNAAAAGGQDPNAAPPPMNFMPSLAPKTAAAFNEDDLATEDECLALGMPYPKTAEASPVLSAMQEMFGAVPSQAAADDPSVTTRAGAIMEMIAASRRSRNLA